MAMAHGGARSGAGRPYSLTKRLAQELAQENVTELRAAREAARASLRSLLPACIVKLKAGVDRGDVPAIRTVLQYTMLTAKEEADIAQADALERLAAFAGTTKEDLLTRGVDDRLARAAAVESFARLWVSGDPQASRYLCERYLGEPAQSMASRISGMTADEAREALLQEYLAEGKPEDEARRLATLPSAKPEAEALSDEVETEAEAE